MELNNTDPIGHLQADGEILDWEWVILPDGRRVRQINKVILHSITLVADPLPGYELKVVKEEKSDGPAIHD